MSDTPTPPLDKRLIERLIRRGELKRSEVDKVTSALPDVAEHGAVIDVEAVLEEVRQGRRRSEGA